MPVEGKYYIVNKKSSLYLDVDHMETKNGARIQQHEFNGGANQIWSLIEHSNNEYEIVAAHNGGCIDDAELSRANGSLVHYWQRHGGDNQRWFFQEEADNYYLIISKKGDLCIDGRDETQNRAGIHLWSILKSDTQLWKIVSVTEKNVSDFHNKESENVIKYNIDDLARVDVPTDLMDKLDIKQLSSKVKDILGSLADAGDNMQKLQDQGWWEQKWKDLKGDNMRLMANAEKAVVDASKFNVALSCLLVLFSKAIKQQQDEIIDQQTKIKKQQDDILKLQGVTKEQADRIINLIEADNFVTTLVEKAKDELCDSINKLSSQHKTLNDIVNTAVKNLWDSIHNLDNRTKAMRESITENSSKLDERKSEIEKIQSDLATTNGNMTDDNNNNMVKFNSINEKHRSFQENIDKISNQFDSVEKNLSQNLISTNARLQEQITKNMDEFISFKNDSKLIMNRTIIAISTIVFILLLLLVYMFFGK